MRKGPGDSKGGYSCDCCYGFTYRVLISCQGPLLLPSQASRWWPEALLLALF